VTKRLRTTLILAAAGIFLLSLPASADEYYKVTVTRKGSDLYQINGNNTYILTRYCYEYVYYEDAILKMSGSTGEIIFVGSGGSKCDVVQILR
jgi:hypothetical protein